MHALFSYTFMQNALIAGLLASIVCGIIGVIIVEKKMIMMAGGIAHTAYGGVGLGYLFGFEPILGAFLFSGLAAIGIGRIKRKGGIQADIIIGLFWSLGMALGVLFVSIMPGYPPDMNSYLFGNILSVTKADLLLMGGVTIVVVSLVLVFYNWLKTYLFDEQFAKIIGVSTAIFEYALLFIISITVVSLIRVAGIILVLALLTAPAATAGLVSKKLNNRIWVAIILGMFFIVIGLVLSYFLDIATGACIVIVSISFYFLVYFIQKSKEKKKRRNKKLQN